MDRIIVGIAGGTGSGKTTIAKNLMKHLPKGDCVLIDHDSYYKDHSDLPPEERLKLNYDHPDSLDNELLIEHIKGLKSGNSIDKPVYNFVTHAREDKVEKLEAAPVVIVEGILVFADEILRELFDIKIFVDTDADLRVIRRVRRDMEKRGRTFNSIRKQYYSTVRPMHIQFVEPSKRWANIIIPEGGENKIALDIVAEKLMRFLGDPDRK
jgi:uridine kinase